MTKEQFVRDYGRCLMDGTAAIFAGAGLSRPAGFVDWKELMREIASDLNLQVDKELDLIAIAQYHVNERKNRAKLNETLIEQFTKDARTTLNHSLIARLPVHTVWTTNYDTLIERAFEDQHKRVDVKIEPESLAFTKRGTDVTVFKMHGDVSAPHKAVLTKEDYETYSLNRELFTIRLKGDLVSQTFLFLGFSFADPNIEYILSRIRGLLGHNTPTHYCVMRRPVLASDASGAERAEFEYESRKMALRVGDLQRYGIQTVLIDDYSEISWLLQEVNRLAFLNNIFVSGSAAEGQADFDLNRLMGLSRLLGKEIIERGYNLVSGYGWGVGSEVIVGALEAAYGQFSSLHDRLVLRPFPRSVDQAHKSQIYDQWRESMLSLSGVSVFVAGNKRDQDSGKIILGDGVRREFEIGSAAPLHNYPIPIGVTGYVAREIWEKVSADSTVYFGAVDVKEPLHALGRTDISNEAIIEAVFSIIRRCSGAGRQ